MMKGDPTEVFRALVWVVLVVLSSCRNETPIEPGDELHSILEEAVLEVSLRAPTKRARAQRRQAHRPFEYTFEGATGTKRHRCAASAKLDQATALAFEVRVRSVLDADQAEAFLAAHKTGWTTLEIRSFMIDDQPFRLDLLRDPNMRERAYARQPRDARLFVVDSKLMRLLDLDCEPM
jgi:hypothetical protein